MADIALKLQDSRFALALAGNDLARDDGLETATFLSLFTDARAKPDQVQAAYTDDLRGWWADIASAPGDSFGSLLWTLQPEKQTGSVLARAKQYATDALAWMIADFIAERIDVATSYPSRGVMRITVDIYRPGKKEPARYRYDYEWAAQAAART